MTVAAFFFIKRGRREVKTENNFYKGLDSGCIPWYSTQAPLNEGLRASGENRLTRRLVGGRGNLENGTEKRSEQRQLILRGIGLIDSGAA